MPSQHATGTLGILSSSELDRDSLVGAGSFGWFVQSGTVTFSAGLTFNVAAVAAGDYMVNGALGAVYAGGTVVLSTQDATLPRVDIVVITAAGAVSAVAGTPKALTSTSGPVPTAPTSAQLEIARIYVPASGTSLTSANITDRRLTLAQSASTSYLVRKYMTSTQVFTTNTTFADIIAGGPQAPLTFSFPIAASEVWEADYSLPLTFGGTGGVKLQLTGPAAPTAVYGESFGVLSKRTGEDSGATIRWQRWVHERLATITAFSSSVVAINSEAAAEIVGVNVGFATDRVFPTTGVTLVLRCLIRNGSTAGTVTLQGAQNSSNSTTTFGLGCFMEARRLG